ncbi:MAG: 3-deoxy-8-phosphooctulonate synthase, partial [Bacteroidetes bacterium]|nr:3-deoxy-8-phosphooctulonate synthase [Bacteroidota bacterium]
MKVRIRELTMGEGERLVLIAGPCVVESRDLVLRTAEAVRETAARHNVPVVFKSSYKKANRTSGSSFVGMGMDEALEILMEVKTTIGMPVLTDIHSESEAGPAGDVADVLQIPAFLCRQTDLIMAAAEHGKAVNIKKGQF